LTQLGSQALYHYQIFKKLSFHAGYQRSQARIHNPDRWSEPTQYLDFGLDYGDALSLQLSRRTLLTFGVSLGSARAVPGTTQYRVLGNANLSHSMGRTWSANVGVARSLGFVAAFQQPVLSDAAFASIGGQLATRVSSVSTASWTRGYIGLDSARHFDSSGASSVLSVGVTRRIGAFAQYSYYRNRLPTGATTLAVLSNFDRQTASVGLTFYAPLYNSQRNR
jgi:hypothetical protein